MSNKTNIEQTDMQFVYEFHKEMCDQDLMLVYEGEINQDIANTVLAMTKKNMESENEENTVKKKVFNIMVECLQNIAKHSDENAFNDSTSSAIFMLGRVDNEYVITTGNPMQAKEIENLKEKLDKVNSLDKDGLKALYKEIRLNGSLSEKGGAGLGFVDIARKSGKELIYDFQVEENDLAFFSFQVRIPRN